MASPPVRHKSTLIVLPNFDTRSLIYCSVAVRSLMPPERSYPVGIVEGDIVD